MSPRVHTAARREELSARDVVIVPYIAVIVGMYAARSVWIAFWLYQLGMVAVLTYDRQWFRLRDLVRVRPGWIVSAGTATVLAGPALYALASPNGIEERLVAGTAVFGPSAAAWPLFIAGFCLTNPWLEELFWRGYLGTPSTRLVWSDILFAGYHPLFLVPFVGWWWATWAFVILIAVAWTWRQLTRASDGLLGAAISHLMADASILFAAWMLVGRG